MQILQNPTATPECVLVLGMFDGVHRGHQELLRQGRALADEHGLPLYVCTFEPHPIAVLFPERTPPRLTTRDERAVLMASYGVDVLCETTFTRTYAAMQPEDFVRQMVQVYHPQYVVTGFNYTFGDRGRGNAAMLQAMQSACGYQAVTVPAVVLEGDTVSSTRVRKLLTEGSFDQALRLLGHGYTMCGMVAHGKKIGRTMGFPTANIAVASSKVMPAYGVYACTMTVAGDERIHHAVVNVGRHPTLPEGTLTVEAHVLDETLPLYDAQATLDFLSFRRPERVFAGVEELRAQITRDAEDARAFFAARQ